MTELTYLVPGVSCDHCRSALQSQLGALAGVERVAVDLAGKRVTVVGRDLDDCAIRAAIREAGYEAA